MAKADKSKSDAEGTKKGEGDDSPPRDVEEILKDISEARKKDGILVHYGDTDINMSKSRKDKFLDFKEQLVRKLGREPSNPEVMDYAIEQASIQPDKETVSGMADKLKPSQEAMAEAATKLGINPQDIPTDDLTIALLNTMRHISMGTQVMEATKSLTDMMKRRNVDDQTINVIVNSIRELGESMRKGKEEAHRQGFDFDINSAFNKMMAMKMMDSIGGGEGKPQTDPAVMAMVSELRNSQEMLKNMMLSKDQREMQEHMEEARKVEMSALKTELSGIIQAQQAQIAQLMQMIDDKKAEQLELLKRQEDERKEAERIQREEAREQRQSSTLQSIVQSQQQMNEQNLRIQAETLNKLAESLLAAKPKDGTPIAGMSGWLQNAKQVLTEYESVKKELAPLLGQAGAESPLDRLKDKALDKLAEVAQPIAAALGQHFAQGVAGQQPQGAQQPYAPPPAGAPPTAAQGPSSNTPTSMLPNPVYTESRIDEVTKQIYVHPNDVPEIMKAVRQHEPTAEAGMQRLADTQKGPQFTVTNAAAFEKVVNALVKAGLYDRKAPPPPPAPSPKAPLRMAQPDGTTPPQQPQEPEKKDDQKPQ